MGQISIKIQNRTYRLRCGDGEEERLTALAQDVREKAERLVAEYGRISDEHLMLMSALLIADELSDERAKHGPKPADASEKTEDKGDNERAAEALAE